MSVSIVIPAYNEEQRLPATLPATADYFAKRGEPYDILVVDDGSVDKTAAVVADFRSSHPKVDIQCVQYGANKGKGYAVRFGMLRATGDLRLFCDADLATPPEDFDVIVAAMRETGAVIGIGSRAVPESQLLVRESWSREISGRLGNKLLVQKLLLPGIQDSQCGFKVFTAAAAQEVFSRCEIDQFAFDMEALYVARCLGYTVAEVPIRWSHKAGSKYDPVRDGIKALVDLCAIRWIHRSLPAINSSPTSSSSV